MNKIKVYTGYSYRRDCYLYTNFEIVDELPKIGDTLLCNGAQTETITSIEKMWVEGHQPTDKCYDYDYYRVTAEIVEIWNDGDEPEISENDYYYAIEIND